MWEWIGSYDLEEFFFFCILGIFLWIFYFFLFVLFIWGGVFEIILYNFKLIVLIMICCNVFFCCGLFIGFCFLVVKVIGDYLEWYWMSDRMGYFVVGIGEGVGMVWWGVCGGLLWVMGDGRVLMGWRWV